MPSHRAWGALAGLLVCLLALATAMIASAGLHPNPANDKRLISKPLEDYRYDRATRCMSGARKGARALERWLQRNVRGTSWGITRCERWGKGSASVHAEGRAIDWHLDAGVKREKKAAMALIRALLKKDRRGNHAALARRMGVQGLIFNCKSWWSSPGGLSKYSYCYRANGKKKSKLDRTQAHKDHVHIELNWPGARKRTSFWKSPLAAAGFRP